MANLFIPLGKTATLPILYASASASQGAPPPPGGTVSWYPAGIITATLAADELSVVIKTISVGNALLTYTNPVLGGNFLSIIVTDTKASSDAFDIANVVIS